MSRVKNAIVEANQKLAVERKIRIFWMLCEPVEDTDGPLTDRILKYMETKHTVRTLEWLFSRLPYVQVDASLHTEDDIQDGTDEVEEIGLDEDALGVWFKRNDWVEGRWQMVSLEAREEFGESMSDEGGPDDLALLAQQDLGSGEALSEEAGLFHDTPEPK